MRVSGLAAVFGIIACGVSAPESPPEVRSIVISPATDTVAVGDSIEFVARVNADLGISREVAWFSDPPSIGIVAATTDTVFDHLPAPRARVTIRGATPGNAAVCATSVPQPAVRTCAAITVIAQPLVPPGA